MNNIREFGHKLTIEHLTNGSAIISIRLFSDQFVCNAHLQKDEHGKWSIDKTYKPNKDYRNNFNTHPCMDACLKVACSVAKSKGNIGAIVIVD